jgi:23S rRNA (cytidine1920-2'-O)/16S rRNA (cytidine1409-2'-O)-methyltransferase
LVKERVDVILAKRGLAPSREKARLFIMAGEIYIGDQRITSPDKKFSDDVDIEVRRNPLPYVSFGGLKLEGAMKKFAISVDQKIALDIGSSTGGFVDYLLQHGVSKIYAVDTGTYQLHGSLRNNERVILRENFNARYLTYDDIGEFSDIVTIDVSFISLKKILPVLVPLIARGGHVISLVKPQFEVGRYEVGKGGIVKDEAKIARVLEDIQEFGKSIGLVPISVAEAARDKERKNREYFILWELLHSPSQPGTLQA